MKTYATGNDKGFTFIEVLVAITLLAVGILAVASMQVTALGGNDAAEEITEASTLATDQLETLLSLSYTDAMLQDDPGSTGNFLGTAGLNNPLPPGGGTPDPTTYPADFSTVTPDGKYTIYWNIAEDYPVPNTKTIRVVVVQSNVNRVVVLTGALPRIL